LGELFLNGFFDVDDRLKRLSDLGDQLEAFRTVVDFELFRPELNMALAYSDGSQGGRPPFDPVMMFKILVIQAANNLSDERTEFLINDRLSFMRFLGLSLLDRVPDARTICVNGGVKPGHWGGAKPGQAGCGSRGAASAPAEMARVSKPRADAAFRRR
jgi:hypothetical protein